MNDTVCALLVHSFHFIFCFALLCFTLLRFTPCVSFGAVSCAMCALLSLRSLSLGFLSNFLFYSLAFLMVMMMKKKNAHDKCVLGAVLLYCGGSVAVAGASASALCISSLARMLVHCFALPIKPSSSHYTVLP